MSNCRKNRILIDKNLFNVIKRQYQTKSIKDIYEGLNLSYSAVSKAIEKILKVRVMIFNLGIFIKNQDKRRIKMRTK